MLADFPFDTTSDRANAWGLLMTLITRQMVNLAQIALVDAPLPGTGKTLLVKVLVWIATGASTPMQTMPRDEEEMRKVITATLVGGESLMVIDNVNDVVDSPSIASATSNDEWTGRILGTSQNVRLPNSMTWVLTGNQIRTSSEIVRRCFRIRLDARTAHPDLRTEFRHPNLLTYVRDHRTEIVEAMMVVVRSWVAAGRPAGSAVRAGEFPEWADMIGGILNNAGVTGFLENMMELRQSADAESDEWASFIAAWAEVAQQCVLWLATLPGLEGEISNPVVKRQAGANDENADLGEFLLIWEGLGAVNTRTALTAADGWAKTSPKRGNLDLTPQAKALRDYLEERVKAPCVANLSTILTKLKPRTGDGRVIACADGRSRTLKRTNSHGFYVSSAALPN